jgi:adenylylsulfate kinase
MACFTLWLTGLPSSGKTSIAKEIKSKLEKKKFLVEHLDGDVIRKLPNWNLNFSKKDRFENINRIARIASYLSQTRITICSFVSPYEEARKLARKCCYNFIEVYVDCPIEVCIKRDVKGMYKKAKNKEIVGFTGIDAPYEIPAKPEIVCNTEKETLDESADKILDYLSRNNLI